MSGMHLPDLGNRPACKVSNLSHKMLPGALLPREEVGIGDTCQPMFDLAQSAVPVAARFMQSRFIGCSRRDPILPVNIMHHQTPGSLPTLVTFDEPAPDDAQGSCIVQIELGRFDKVKLWSKWRQQRATQAAQYEATCFVLW